MAKLTLLTVSIAMNLVYYPDPKLTLACSPVEKYGQELADTVMAMMDVMYRERGVGLAAPQVGLETNILIVDSSAGEEDNKLIVFVNPKIVWSSDRHVPLKEGCLSMPGVSLNVLRPAEVEVEFNDVEGNLKRLNLKDWEARILQHEYDHLSGIMMVDRVNRHDRRAAIKAQKSVKTHSAKVRV